MLIGADSCVKTDYTLAYNLIPEYDKYITRHFSIPIDSVLVAHIDSLSAYSSSRMTIGALRDEKFGLTRRGAAFPLIPMTDTLKWGTNVRFVRFHLAAARDTLSYVAPNQANIFQNFRVYALPFVLDSTKRYSCDFGKSTFDGKPEISLGVPVYTGGDSLSFDLSEAFARTYWEGYEGQSIPIDTVYHYTKKHPGIYICCDDPYGYGGRLNFFDIAASLDSYGYLSGTYASLRVIADYGTRKDVDTTFYFNFGGTSGDSEASYYSFNTCEHESVSMGGWGTPVDLQCGPSYSKKAYLVNDKITIEGGTGLKPVIEAKHLRNIIRQAMRDTLVKYGYDPETALKNKRVIINKATITLPYDFPADYEQMSFYPQVLNPTLRLSKPDTVSYAGLTDASVSDENQGEIDRNVDSFHPDMSHHIQQILCTTNPDTLRRENIWFLILANETTESSSSSSSSTSDYYSQMAYLNYYNSLLGGYGSYGGYGSSYDNYYSYYMMQAMYSSMYSSSSSSTSTELDRDRYYSATLRGPGADKNIGDVPHVDITYSFLLP